MAAQAMARPGDRSGSIGRPPAARHPEVRSNGDRPGHVRTAVDGHQVRRGAARTSLAEQIARDLGHRKPDRRWLSRGEGQGPGFAWNAPRVDGVALASVITSGVLGLHQHRRRGLERFWLTTRTARETQVRQRRCEAYLELLRLVEREGLWVHHGIDHFEAQAYDRYDYINSMQVPSVPQPPVTDRAAMTALPSARGTDAVRERHKRAPKMQTFRAALVVAVTGCSSR